MNAVNFHSTANVKQLSCFPSNRRFEWKRKGCVEFIIENSVESGVENGTQ